MDKSLLPQAVVGDPISSSPPDVPADIFRQRSPVIAGKEPTTVMESIRGYVRSTAALYEKVFECLKCDEAFFVRPVHKLRHPLIFYYGHTAAFYINKLCAAGLTTRINPQMEDMFAIGVDEMSWDDLNEEHYSWPTVKEVREYRRLVHARIDSLIASGKFQLELPLTFANSTQNDSKAFWWLMLMGSEHERIHVETASVHVRELPIQFVRSSMSSFWRRFPESSGTAPTNELVPIAGGRVNVGRHPDSSLYGWDCDYSDGDLWVDVAPFQTSKYIVSNGEFFQFMMADGYATKRYWDEEGWKWVQWTSTTHPWFWVSDASRPDRYALRLQTELIDLPWDWPCEMNNLEARAFCNFLSEKMGTKVRMLTEAEWLLLFDRNVTQDQPQWDKAPGNLNLEHYLSSCPVDTFSHGGLYDVVGNVWQHCETAVYPYKGYRVHPFYDDFSQPTFDGRHTCMKGGAWISTGNEATRDARFAFRRHFFQYIGLRYVVGEEVNEGKHLRSMLGLDPEVDMLTDANYRESFNGIPNGYLRLAEYAKSMFTQYAKVPPRRALDFSCGAGRVSFELSLLFDHVIGADYTARLLLPVFAIRERGNCQYSTIPSPGADRVACTVDSHAYDWSTTLEKATFTQADPTNLHSYMKDFSLIVCWDCLERSVRPSIIPPHLLSRLEPGGLLIVGTYPRDSIMHIAHESIVGGNGTTADPLLSPAEDNHEAIFKFLGGINTVKCVGEDVSIPVVIPLNNADGHIRNVRLSAYLKL